MRNLTIITCTTEHIKHEKYKKDNLVKYQQKNKLILDL